MISDFIDDRLTLVNLIGAGSIGSFTDLVLAIIGRNAPLRLVIWDYDTLQNHNPINQLYRDRDVQIQGKPQLKTRALRSILNYFSPVGVDMINERVGEETPLWGITVVMVDSLEERRKIFRAVKYKWPIPLYIDARSGGNLAVVFALDPRDADQIAKYEKTLQGTSTPAPCADANTIPTLVAIASVITKLIHEFRIKKVATFTETLINFATLPIINQGTLGR